MYVCMYVCVLINYKYLYLYGIILCYLKIIFVGSLWAPMGLPISLVN